MSTVNQLKLNFESVKLTKEEKVQKTKEKRLETLGKLSHSITQISSPNTPLVKLLNERRGVVELLALTDDLVQLQALQNTEQFWNAHPISQ
jgi:hypothetical protein